MKFVVFKAFISAQIDINQKFVSEERKYINPNDDERISCQILCSIPFLILSIVLMSLLICSLFVDSFFFLLTIGKVNFVTFHAFTTIHTRISEHFKTHGCCA